MELEEGVSVREWTAKLSCVYRNAVDVPDVGKVAMNSEIICMEGKRRDVDIQNECDRVIANELHLI
jgi:hypothetical protein